MIEMIIEKNDSGQRLDRFLKKYYRNATLGHIYKMIRKDIKVNGKRPTIETALTEGDVLVVYIDNDKSEQLRGEAKTYVNKKQFTVAYEDQHLLVVNKPLGLLTHGDKTEKKNTLANQVCGYLMEKGEYIPGREKTFVPAPVNRLDRNTTGLVIFGKDGETTRELNRLLRERDQIEKYYRALVVGNLTEELYLKDNMEKDHQSNKVSISDQGKTMETVVRPIASGNGYSLVEIKLLTGRTHQIRVHLASIGHPIVGDSKYGNPRADRNLRMKYNISTQLLHSGKLVFTEGRLKGKVIEGPLPDNFQEVVDSLFNRNQR